VEIFDIIPVGPVDLIEIIVVTYILYRLYMLMRGTLAVSILVGLGGLYLVQFIVNATGMKILQALFGSLSEIYVLAVIIIFQQEIRRVLLLVGQNPLFRQLFFSRNTEREMLTEVVAAVRRMSEQKVGALIVFRRSVGLRNYIETGELLQGRVSRDLLTSIFYSGNPLHDGAVIISAGRIEAARCILPVSASKRLSPLLGLRHRAAVGISEETDAFVVVVSEETGRISVAEEGVLSSVPTVDELPTRLTDAL